MVNDLDSFIRFIRGLDILLIMIQGLRLLLAFYCVKDPVLQVVLPLHR